MRAPDASPTTTAFHREFYDSVGWSQQKYLGYTVLQNPCDLQVYQEILFKVRPQGIVQTGVWGGGSLLFFACLLDLLKMDAAAKVIGIDIKLSHEALRLDHPRIHLVEGDSTAPETFQRVRSLLPEGPCLVSLDSDHTCAHVAKEVELYHGLVSVGSYLVVEDTNINGHPVLPTFGAGPREAVEEFLPRHPEFVQDDEVWEQNLFSFHQHGWLRRVR